MGRVSRRILPDRLGADQSADATSPLLMRLSAARNVCAPPQSTSVFIVKGGFTIECVAVLGRVRRQGAVAGYDVGSFLTGRRAASICFCRAVSSVRNLSVFSPTIRFASIR